MSSIGNASPDFGPGAAGATALPPHISRLASTAGPRIDAVTMAGTAVARYGVALVLLAIGVLKFTPAEAEAIRPLVSTSPLLSWMYSVWSVQAASSVIGVIELIAALGIVRSRLFRGRRLLQDMLFEYARDAGFETARSSPARAEPTATIAPVAPPSSDMESR